MSAVKPKASSKKNAQSIEPNIADMVNGWLKGYKLDYKLEQESLNDEIDKALYDYYTKNGGTGANRPDAKLLLRDKETNDYPILIEYKGYKNKLVKLNAEGQVENKTSKNEPHFANINGYAVNGAVHYANALLHHTNYTDIISIGVTGHKDASGQIQYEIGVYFVSKSNLGIGQKIGDYTDLSFLKKENFDDFINRVKELELTQAELDKLKEQREKEIDVSLSKLNNDIYQNEKGLSESDRVYLVAASIIATIGIPDKVKPLDVSELRSSKEIGSKDGDIILRKIHAFLNEKGLPHDKKQLIIRTLENTLTTENINRVENGETQLKRVFRKIIDDLGIYYKIGLSTDFTGKLFNEMYGWLGFSQDKLNDVVLTPSYVATLLTKLARVDRNSYVWDFATGSAGLLVSAMNEMLTDAKSNIESPDELRKKEIQIKAEQLLGLELLPSVYMLAILNMILMGDGSSNILNTDSLKDFDGKYGFGRIGEYFPATAFILNPPYSADGNGMNFVEKALNMMNKGYAAIIIQGSAGSGKATEINKRILKKHTLIASIKMPVDIFIGKSSVQTYIYVFKVNEAHHPDEVVKFIDFTNDGYTRTSRKKAAVNLRDTDQAKERYEELVNLVRFGRSKLKIFTDQEYYEGTIDPKSGKDWNKSAPIDTKPTLNDFRKTIGDYLAWEISTLLKSNIEDDVSSGKGDATLTTNFQWGDFKINDLNLTIHEQNALSMLSTITWSSFNLKMLFGHATRGKRLKSEDRVLGTIPFVTAGEANEGVSAFIANDVTVFQKNTTTIDMFGSAKYRNYDYGCDDHVAVVHTEELPKYASIFVTVAIHKSSYNGQFNYGRNFYAKDADDLNILLPIKNGQPDYEFMENYVSAIHKLTVRKIAAYLDDKKA